MVSAGYDAWQKLSGPGVNRTASLDEANATIGSLKGTYSDLEAQVQSLNDRLTGAWQGAAGDAAVRSASPLVKAFQVMQDNLTLHASGVGDQSGQYGYSAGQMRQIPPNAPSNNFLNEMTPWHTDLDTQMSNYNGADAHNLAVLNDYQNTTQNNITKLPADYQRLSSDSVPNIQIVNPATTAGGGGWTPPVGAGGGRTGGGSGGGAGGRSTTYSPGGASMAGRGGGGPTGQGGVAGTGGGGGQRSGPGGGYQNQAGGNTYGQAYAGSGPVAPAPYLAAALDGSGGGFGTGSGPGVGGAGGIGAAAGGFGSAGGAGRSGGSRGTAGGYGADGGRGTSGGSGAMSGVGGEPGGAAAAAAAAERAGAARSGSMAPGMGPMGGGRGGGKDDAEHKTASYLVDEDNGNSIVGPLDRTAPPVIGG